ncbi:ABC transporter permease [Hyalangium sp.]|uniref:ABC transporter permease n=1 Tax=Hyalangium sp. TaxID=2028555 RepID=UPI002D56BC14|nr:ABC transporter permease subunit [Hyalangium sp.]HYI00378.1 ABC transporter permease subunit [Hyalangium sp.]
MRPFLALTFNGFREARRNRVTVVVGAFAFGLLVASSLLTNLSISTFDRVLTDVGLGIMSIVLVLLAVFLSSGMLSREIERKTLFLIVSKPISRSQFLIARFAGNMLTLAVLLLAMGVLFFIQIGIYGTLFTEAQFVAIGMLFFELLILSSVGFVMSSFSSQMVSATVTIGAYFAGHLGGDIYEMSRKAEEPFLQLLGKAVYYVLPNLSRLNYRVQATYEIPTPMSELLPSILYAVSYSAVLIVLASFIFSRRDFK